VLLPCVVVDVTAASADVVVASVATAALVVTAVAAGDGELVPDFEFKFLPESVLFASLLVPLVFVSTINFE